MPIIFIIHTFHLESFEVAYYADHKRCKKAGNNQPGWRDPQGRISAQRCLGVTKCNTIQYGSMEDFHNSFPRHNPFKSLQMQAFPSQELYLQHPQIVFFPREHRSGFTAYRTAGKITVICYNNIQRWTQSTEFLHQLTNALLERKVVANVFRTFSVSYRIWRSITVLTAVRHKTTSSHPISLKFVLILSSKLRLGIYQVVFSNQGSELNFKTHLSSLPRVLYATPIPSTRVDYSNSKTAKSANLLFLCYRFQ
jgi:hypothetical protein